MSVVAIDAKGFLRKGYRRSDGKYSEFRAVLGTAIKFKDKDDFKDEYDQIIEKLAKKYGIPREHKVIKSYEILSALRYPQGPAFIEQFFKGVADLLKNVIIYYTTIPSTKVPQVKKYGADKTGVQLVDPMTFLKDLEPSYPHCCAWKYESDNPKDRDTPLFVDHFEGELTDAWKQIRALPNIRIYTAGDQCNCYISTADIITKLVDLRLYAKHMTLYKTCIQNCFPDFDIEIQFIDELRFITPISREKIDIRTKLAHPMIFIMKEGVYTDIVGSAKERDIISFSPLMDKILDKAYDIDGCAKFFDAKGDQKLIVKGDYFLCLGNKGLKMSKYLQSLGYDVKIISPKEL